jgi:SAM-dependent methyltransferase
VSLRTWTRTFVGGRLATGMAALNARHPWSHNDHFHGWILANLPDRRRTALDVGCGEGGLLAALAPYVDEVHGTDVDPEMRRRAAERCSGLANVTVDDEPWAARRGPYDVVTMVAVLHHLDEAEALQDARRLLAPGGRLLAVGLARPVSAVDHLWDAASILTNPLIGYVKHPWRTRIPVPPPAYAVLEPTLPLRELRTLVHEAMPGADVRHRLGFRHTIAWTRPE